MLQKTVDAHGGAWDGAMRGTGSPASSSLTATAEGAPRRKSRIPSLATPGMQQKKQTHTDPCISPLVTCSPSCIAALDGGSDTPSRRAADVIATVYMPSAPIATGSGALVCTPPPHRTKALSLLPLPPHVRLSTNPLADGDGDIDDCSSSSGGDDYDGYYPDQDGNVCGGSTGQDLNLCEPGRHPLNSDSDPVLRLCTPLGNRATAPGSSFDGEAAGSCPCSATSTPYAQVYDNPFYRRQAAPAAATGSARTPGGGAASCGGAAGDGVGSTGAEYRSTAAAAVQSHTDASGNGSGSDTGGAGEAFPAPSPLDGPDALAVCATADPDADAAGVRGDPAEARVVAVTAAAATATDGAGGGAGAGPERLQWGAPGSAGGSGSSSDGDVGGDAGADALSVVVAPEPQCTQCCSQGGESDSGCSTSDADGASVVGAPVVGAPVVGAPVVGTGGAGTGGVAPELGESDSGGSTSDTDGALAVGADGASDDAGGAISDSCDAESGEVLAAATGAAAGDGSLGIDYCHVGGAVGSGDRGLDTNIDCGGSSGGSSGINGSSSSSGGGGSSGIGGTGTEPLSPRAELAAALRRMEDLRSENERLRTQLSEAQCMLASRDASNTAPAASPATSALPAASAPPSPPPLPDLSLLPDLHRHLSSALSAAVTRLTAGPVSTLTAQLTSLTSGLVLPALPAASELLAPMTACFFGAAATPATTGAMRTTADTQGPAWLPPSLQPPAEVTSAVATAASAAATAAASAAATAGAAARLFGQAGAALSNVIMQELLPGTESIGTEPGPGPENEAEHRAPDPQWAQQRRSSGCPRSRPCPCP